MSVINVILYILYVSSLTVMTLVLLGSLLEAWKGELKGVKVLYVLATLGSTLALIDKVF